MVLIKCYFYVTEESRGGKKLAFYLNRVYEKLALKQLRKMIQNRTLQRIRRIVFLYAKSKNNFIGEWKIRFLPKGTSCRPIIYCR